MGIKKAPKSPAKAPKAPSSLKPNEIANLEGVKDIITHLKKGDWAGMAGAMMTLYKEYFGTPKEKAEIAKAREAKAKKDTKDGLKKLKADVDEGHGHEHAHDHVHEQEEEELVKNPELGDGREYVLIGDSAAKGMYLSYGSGKRPGFIGEIGLSTGEVLRELKKKKSQLKGKKKAMIYCAGNNILGTPTDKLVSDMVEMAKICAAKGTEIPEIIVNTQFPPISNYKKNLGPKKFEELKKRNEALRKALLESGKSGELSKIAGVRVVDLTKPFSDENEEMKAAFVNPKEKKDFLHPWFAYKPALEYMQRDKDSRVA